MDIDSLLLSNCEVTTCVARHTVLLDFAGELKREISRLGLRRSGGIGALPTLLKTANLGFDSYHGLTSHMEIVMCAS